MRVCEGFGGEFIFLFLNNILNINFYLLGFRCFSLGSFFFLKQKSPLALTQDDNQVPRCHLPSALLRVAEPDPRLTASPSPGPLRTGSANAGGEGELPGTRSVVSLVLQDPPAAASEMPIRIKKTFQR